LDASGGSGRVVVLPEAQDLPAGMGELTNGVVVAPSVGLKLRGPPRNVRLWGRTVRWAVMPEAPVDVDCDALAWEKDVRAPSHAGDRWPINEEA
jgi:hypothetical protein